MRRDALLAGTTAFTAALALLFWFQLRESNKLNARLQQKVEALTRASNGNAARPAAAAGAPPPVVVSAPAPAMQAMASDATPAAQTPDAKCEASLARARQSATDEMSRWAVELKLAPDEAQRVTDVRQAQAVARTSCAYGAGPGVDQERLRVQFREALGPAHLAQLVELNASRSAESYVARLAQHFKEQDLPLNDEQVRQLSALYLEEFRRFQREDITRAYPDGPRAQLIYQEENLRLAEERVQRVQTAAPAWLRPEQVEQLRSFGKTDLATRRSSVQTVRDMAGKGLALAAPPLPSIQPAMPPR